MTVANTFAQVSLPDSTKEALARSLLAEFGVTRIHVREPDGELVHRCALPWHNDRKPSASLNYKKLVYKCMACNSSGGLLWFISSCREIPDGQAREWLDSQTGFGSEIDLSALLSLIDAIYDETAKERVPIPSMSSSILKPWKFIHPYMTEDRQVPIENLIKMQVGYAARYQVSKEPEQFSERIIIPHFWKGSLVGWQSRRWYDDGTPKYLSTGDFPRDSTIYNYDPTRSTAVVVESPSSVLRHLHHLPIEGTFGGSVTDRQIRLLAQHPRIILFMDNDLAGWRAVEGHYEEQRGKVREISVGMAERLQDYSDVRVVENPWAADPGDMDDETVDALVGAAVPYAVWKRPEAHLLKKWGGE